MNLSYCASYHYFLHFANFQALKIAESFSIGNNEEEPDKTVRHYKLVCSPFDDLPLLKTINLFGVQSDLDFLADKIILIHILLSFSFKLLFLHYKFTL